jgi:hypothetical protein
MDDLIEGICLIGRTLSLWNCLLHVKNTLAHSLVDAQRLFEPIMTRSVGNAIQLPIENSNDCVRILEVQRLSIIFFRCLLFEGSGFSTKTTVKKIGSSEIPVIPRYIVSAVKRNFHLENISEAIDAVLTESAKCLETQLNLFKVSTTDHSIPHRGLLSSLVSPLVMRNNFDFFSDFIRSVFFLLSRA